MVKVVLWGSLKQAAGGRTEIELEAKNVWQVLDVLGERYPELQPHLERGVSVSIDGATYTVTYFQFEKTGKGQAIKHTTHKNMLNGNQLERTFKSGETLIPADISESTPQSL